MCRGMELKYFLKIATKWERVEVAKACQSSVSYLYQLAGKHRRASPLMATRIEQASRRVAATSEGPLDVVPRESLVRYPEIFAGLSTQD